MDEEAHVQTLLLKLNHLHHLVQGTQSECMQAAEVGTSPQLLTIQLRQKLCSQFRVTGSMK